MGMTGLGTGRWSIARHLATSASSMCCASRTFLWRVQVDAASHAFPSLSLSRSGSGSLWAFHACCAV